MSRRARRPLTPALAAFVLLLAARTAAQPPRPTSYGLTLASSREIANGRIAMVQATAGAAPDRYVVENLTVLQPVEVLVVTRDPADAVKVQVAKVLWDSPEREGWTTGSGAASFRFRTEGDFKVTVTAPARSRDYQLVVWAGDALRPAIASPFVSMDAYRRRHSSAAGSPVVLWLIAGALVAIAGLLAVAVLKGRRGTTAALVCAGVAAASTIVAGGSPLPVSTLNDVWPTGNAISTMKENIAKYQDYKDYNDGLSKAGKTAGDAAKGAAAAKGGSDLLDAYKGLSTGDAQADPNFTPPGSPEIPTSCEQGRDGCESCYADAYANLNRVRFNLERLRSIRGSTEEFYRASVSFGDNVSGIHGVAGLAWQAERRKIEQSFKGFQGSYVKKHTQLMGDLKAALDRIAECEAKHYNNPDWYNRFGFMYYGFMESRYAW